MNFNNLKSVYETTSQKTHYDWGLRDYLLRVYQYMGLALALTAIISMGAASSAQFINSPYANVESSGKKYRIVEIK